MQAGGDRSGEGETGPGGQGGREGGEGRECQEVGVHLAFLQWHLREAFLVYVGLRLRRLAEFSDG